MYDNIVNDHKGLGLVCSTKRPSDFSLQQCDITLYKALTSFLVCSSYTSLSLYLSLSYPSTLGIYLSIFLLYPLATLAAIRRSVERRLSILREESNEEEDDSGDDMDQFRDVRWKCANIFKLNVPSQS